MCAAGVDALPRIVSRVQRASQCESCTTISERRLDRVIVPHVLISLVESISFFRGMNNTQEATTIAETPPVFHTRGYQQELLEESLRSNIVVALNTGSGKTYIAVLRMKHEIEREPRKVCSNSLRDI